LIYQGVAKGISRFKEQKKWLRHPERLLKAAEQCLLLSNEKLPLCVGHGELCRSNLIVTADDNIVLVDWEHSRELPIAEELVRLMCRIVRKQPHLI
jgi:thiamine kinase-like enzyme